MSKECTGMEQLISFGLLSSKNGCIQFTCAYFYYLRKLEL